MLVSSLLQKLLVPLLLFVPILLLLLLRPAAVLVSAQDADANVFINFLQTTTMVAAWKTQTLVNWKYPGTGYSVCTVVAGAYECSISNLYGSLSQTRPLTALSRPLRKLGIHSNGSLYGSFDWTSLATFEGQMTHLTIRQVALSTPNFDPSTHLPRSLIHVELYQVFNTISPKNMLNLPPNLQTLNIHDNRFQGEFNFQALPRSVTYIDIEKNDFSGEIVLQNFPPNLTHLNTRENKLLNGTFDMSLLPATMQKLYLSNHANLRGTIDFSIYIPRPAALTHFEVQSTGVGGDVVLDGIDKITTLLHLHLGNNKLTGKFDTTKLPCNALKTLIIYQNSFVGALDMRPVCMDSIENLWFYNNKIALLHLPVTSRNSMNLTVLRAYSNQICCFLNADQLPNNGKLSEVDISVNNYTELINEAFFPDTIKILKFARQNAPVGMVGTFNIAEAPRSLVDLEIHYNVQLVGSMGDLRNAPRPLKEVDIQGNRFTGQIDWANSPTDLDRLIYSENLFTSMVNFPPANSRQIRYLNVGSNRIRSTIDLASGNLPPTLQQLIIQRNYFYGQFALLQLPAKMTVLHLDNNKFANETYLIDLNHLPRTLSTFDMRYSGLTAEVRFDVANIPDKWDSWSMHKNFCDLVLQGNRIRELLFCNETMTITKSLWSLTKTKTSRTRTMETASESNSGQVSETRTQSLSLTRTSLDPFRDYMLDVVLFDIKNKPPEWYVLPLRLWQCKRAVPGQVGKLETVLCCPRNETTGLHSCRFENFAEGHARIYFPPSFPLESFAFAASPNVTGDFRMHQLPSRLTSITIETTKVSATNLWFYDLPPGIINVSLCDNAFVLPDVSFERTPPRLKNLRLCGGRIQGTRNFRGLPDNMELLDLSRQLFSGPVPWHLLPKGVKNVNLAGNRFVGKVALSDIPRSIVTLNISANKFDGTPDLNGTLPPNLQILDMSTNALGGRPIFSNLPASLRQLFAQYNFFDGELLSVKNVPPSLQRLVLRNNKYIGDFEVTDGSLPPHILANLSSFCDDILTGNLFWESRTCDWTHSRSESVSETKSGGSSTRSKSTTRTSSRSISDSHDSKTHEISLTQNTSTISLSDVNLSETSTFSAASASLARTTATASDTANSRSKSDRRSESKTIPLPKDYWNREPVSKGFLSAGAAASAFLTPSIPAAAALVSRQIAISRAYGGKNNTCGCPTREDPLAEFENPLQLDFAPEQCHGQLAGIFVGNLALSLAIPLCIWLLFAIFFVGRYQQFPSFWDAADNGWPVGALSLFAYAVWMPPAVSAMLCAAVRCSWGFGGAGAAIVYTLMPFGLYYFMFRRERHEKFCHKKYHVSKKKESCFRTKRFLQWAFAPNGQWVWKPHLVREAIEERKTKSKETETEGGSTIVLSDSDINNNNNNNDDDIDNEIAPITNQKQHRQQPPSQHQHEQQQQHKDRNEFSVPKLEQDEFVLPTPPETDQQEQRFTAQYRLEDKYVKQSWWFLCFEFAIRGFMTIGPAAAEAVPQAYSCTALRVVYLLAANVLLIAVWSRRPCNHRALFYVLVTVTAVEIVVLCLLLVDDDLGSLLGPWFLGAVQIFATILLLGIEIYEFILCRYSCARWARGRILLPSLAQQQQDDEYKGQGGKNTTNLEEMMLMDNHETTEEGNRKLVDDNNNTKNNNNSNEQQPTEEELDILLGKKGDSKKIKFSPTIYTTVSTTRTPGRRRHSDAQKKRRGEGEGEGGGGRKLFMSDYDLLSDDDHFKNNNKKKDNNNTREFVSHSITSSDDDDDDDDLERKAAYDFKTTRLENLKQDDDDDDDGGDDDERSLLRSAATGGLCRGGIDSRPAVRTEDMFEKLDRRLRRAYVELVHEDEDVVPKNENLESARSEFDKFINL